MILLIHELIGFWHMKLFVFDYKSLFIDIVGFYTCVVCTDKSNVLII